MGENRRLARAWMSLLGLSLLALGVFAYYRIGSFVYFTSYQGMAIHKWRPSPLAVAASITSILAGLLVYAAGRRPSRRLLAASAALAAGLLVLVGLAAGLFYSRPGYYVIRTPLTTDAYVLQVEAARAIVEGKNPYRIDYTAALLEKLPPDPLTWVYRGEGPPYGPGQVVGFVHNFDYLPPAALYYVPAAALGLPPNVWDSLVAGLGLYLLYRRLRPDTRRLYLALLSTGMFLYVLPLIGRTAVTGWLVPLLIAVLYPERPVLAGALLAWSSTYRLYVGVFALYYLLVLHKEGYRAGRVLASAVAWGLLFNLPLAASDPMLVLRMVTIPYRMRLDPLDMGPGLVSLGHLGVFIPKHVLTGLVLAVALGGLAAAWRLYPRMKHAVFALPALAMFLYPRPSYIYYIYFPFLGAVAHLAGAISYLDEVEPVPREEAVATSLGVMAASMGGGLALAEMAVSSSAIKAGVIVAAAAAPLAALAAYARPRWEPPLTAAAVLIVGVLLAAGLLGGGISPVYYIVYSLGDANPLLPGGAGCERASVPSGHPVVPCAALAQYCTSPAVPARLEPLPALLARLGPAAGAALPAAAALLAGLVAVLAARRGLGLAPAIALASAPGVLTGSAGAGVEELLLYSGLLAAAAGLLLGRRLLTVLAVLGAVVAALSAPLGVLVALLLVSSLPPLGPRVRRILAALSGLGGLQTGAFPGSGGYRLLCISRGLPRLGPPAGLVAAVAAFAGALLAGPLPGAPLFVLAGPAYLVEGACSLHAAGAVVVAGALWAVMGTRSLRVCGGARPSC